MHHLHILGRTEIQQWMKVVLLYGREDQHHQYGRTNKKKVPITTATWRKQSGEREERGRREKKKGEYEGRNRKYEIIKLVQTTDGKMKLIP
jgi:hypothetical protein